MHGTVSGFTNNAASIRKAMAYNIALVISLLVLLVIWAIGLNSLERIGRLPAPPITATNCIDEKFKFLHESDLEQVNLLAVGSSVTWRTLDLQVFERYFGRHAQPLNAAPCYVRMNQIAFLTDFYLDHMPQVHTVLSVFAMRDFSQCTNNPTAFFDRQDAARYIFEKSPSWYLYVKNFRPRSFFKDVINLPERRSGENKSETFSMDRYGSSPLRLDVPETRDDVIMDPSCLIALRAMSDKLARRSVNFIAVLLPPMPAWIERYDPDGMRDRAYREAVAAQLDPVDALLIDPAKELALGDEHFTDHAHLQWDSVPYLMQYVIDKLEQLEVRHHRVTGREDAF